MMKCEDDLWKWIKRDGKQFKLHDPSRFIKFERLESIAGSGWADIYFVLRNEKTIHGWIEMKYSKKPDMKVKFREAQPGWLIRHFESDVPTYVLVGSVIDGCDFAYLYEASEENVEGLIDGDWREPKLVVCREHFNLVTSLALSL